MPSENVSVESTYLVGSGASHGICVDRESSSGETQIVILSGYSFGSLAFVCLTQVAAAFLAFWFSEPMFGILFLLMALIVFLWGWQTRGRKLCFEKTWLTLTKESATFADGSVWKRSEIRQFRGELEYVPDWEGGERIGWVIRVVGISGTEKHYLFWYKKDFETFWGEVSQWAPCD